MSALEPVSTNGVTSSSWLGSAITASAAGFMASVAVLMLDRARRHRHTDTDTDTSNDNSARALSATHIGRGSDSDGGDPRKLTTPPSGTALRRTRGRDCAGVTRDAAYVVLVKTSELQRDGHHQHGPVNLTMFNAAGQTMNIQLRRSQTHRRRSTFTRGNVDKFVVHGSSIGAVTCIKVAPSKAKGWHLDTVQIASAEGDVSHFCCNTFFKKTWFGSSDCLFLRPPTCPSSPPSTAARKSLTL